MFFVVHFYNHIAIVKNKFKHTKICTFHTGISLTQNIIDHLILIGRKQCLALLLIIYLFQFRNQNFINIHSKNTAQDGLAKMHILHQR